MSTTTATRSATIGLIGGALWALQPVAWSVTDLTDQEFGSLPFVAVALSYWIFAVLPPALIVVGLGALRRVLGPGLPGRVGSVLAAVGLAAMTAGMGIEVASMSVGGGEVALGHALFLLGFLVSVVGSLPLGIVVFRRRRDPLSRIAGLLMALALPLGIGIGILGSIIAPDGDAGFFAAISVPTGIAWVLLGRALSAAQRSTAGDLATVS
jgi:hypothetical protein